MTEPVLGRRQTVKVGTLVAVSGLSGCVSTFSGTDRTASVFIRNEDEVPHEVAVVLAFRNEMLVDESFTLEQDSDVNTEFQNPDEAGDATLDVGVAGGGSLERPVSVGPGSGIDSIQITIEDGGQISASIGVQ